MTVTGKGWKGEGVAIVDECKCQRRWHFVDDSGQGSWKEGELLFPVTVTSHLNTGNSTSVNSASTSAGADALPARSTSRFVR